MPFSVMLWTGQGQGHDPTILGMRESRADLSSLWVLSWTLRAKPKSCQKPSVKQHMILKKKTRGILTIWSSSCTPWYLPRGVKILCLQKNLNVYSGFLHHRQNLGATKRSPSVGDWRKELCYGQSMKYYSALKRNELPSCEKIASSLKCTLLSGKSQWEKATSCLILTVWHPRKDELWRP